MIPKINKELLPMKGHYLFFNGATAPVIPFLPVMARQMGFSGTLVGIVYTILPIVGMLAKPIVGGIADYFRCKKSLFIVFQIITAISLLGINFIPEAEISSKVHFSCDNGATVVDTNDGTNISVSISDNCAAAKIVDENKEKQSLKCEMSCSVNDNKVFDTVCEYWKSLQYCTDNKNRNKKLDFTALIKLDDIDILDKIMFLRVRNVILEDGSKVQPICPNSTYKISTICDMTCDSNAVNSIISKSMQLDDKEALQVYQFWLFAVLAVFAWTAMAVVVSIGDAICFDLLGDKPNLYGNQRYWGSIGWGLFSVFAGLLVDATSDDDLKKNYSGVFYLALGTMIVDVLISFTLKYSQKKISTNILRDVGKLLASPRIAVFSLWCIFVGMCTGLVWQFLFWHLEDIAREYDDNGGGCSMNTWIKTLEGLVMGVQCLGGELPFFFLSGWILKRIGHVHCMTLVLLAIGVRYILYSVLVNPWWVLPVELTTGVAFGLMYATMTSYASIAAPPGTEATIQGLVGAIFEGVGVSLGSLIGGISFDNYGGWVTFRMFGIASFICCLLHFLVHRFILNSSVEGKDYDAQSTTHYAPPTEALRFLDDDTQELTLVDH